MTYKAGFEPKDARTISTYDEDDDLDDLDDWSLDTSPRPRRRRTNTQALVEFLNTTSPEEFQKTPATSSKRSIFFSRRRNKKKPASNAALNTAPPHIIRRNGYVEIITSHHPRIPYYLDPASPTNMATPAPVTSTSTGANTKRHHHHHHHHHHHRPNNSLDTDQPVLPSSRRESSLYTASIRSMPFSPTSTTSAPDVLSKGPRNATNAPANASNSTNSMPPPPRGAPLTTDDAPKPDADTVMGALDGMDVVEAGLIQRLKQYELYDVDRPSDVVSKTLIEEHLRALNISAMASSPAANPAANPANAPTLSSTARHVQVQTMPIDWKHEKRANAASEAVSADVTPTPTPAASTTTTTTTTSTTISPASTLTSFPKTPSASSSTPHNLHDAATTSTPDMDDDGGPPASPKPTASTSHTLKHQSLSSMSSSTGTPTAAMVEELQRQLIHERQERQRLEAALRNTCDHFEVLSGLAYKKLRELWEEKMRWESACIELNAQLMNQQPSSSTTESRSVSDISC
ncbi:hypothetical protein BC940DRAFT_304075 [Gongronella butleri]|nr:hypothetical protein BC940DRAFT_304075 [Gongronella butleri]